MKNPFLARDLRYEIVGPCEPAVPGLGFNWQNVVMPQIGYVPGITAFAVQNRQNRIGDKDTVWHRQKQNSPS